MSENSDDQIISALRNSGIDTECGACMEVAFTGVTTNAHTCAPSTPATGVEAAKAELAQFIVLWGNTKQESVERRVAAAMVSKSRDALIAAVVTATQERADEGVIAFEGDGIPPGDVDTDYHYEGALVAKKIAAVRAEGAQEPGHYRTLYEHADRLRRDAQERADAAERQLDAAGADGWHHATNCRAFAAERTVQAQAEEIERLKADASEAEDKQVIDCGGMSATFTFDEALAEVQRLGLRCEELYPNEAEVGRLYSRNVKLQATVQAQAEEIARWSSRYWDECAIVDRVWRALGVTGLNNGPEISERVAKLKADLARLRAALVKYGFHRINCPAMNAANEPCLCGFDAALKEIS